MENKYVAVYGLTNTAGVGILDVNDERVEYVDALGKKRRAKVYFTAKGRAYFMYAGGFRIYLDECMRV